MSMRVCLRVTVMVLLLALLAMSGVGADVDSIHPSAVTGTQMFLPFVADSWQAPLPVPDFPVELTLFAPIQGNPSEFGRRMQIAATVAISESEAAGWDAMLTVADTSCDMAIASEATNRVIVDEGKRYLVGALCSSTTVLVSEIAQQNGALLVAPASPDPEVTVWPDGSNKDYVFRSRLLDPQQGTAMGVFAAELGMLDAAVVYDGDNAYYAAQAQTFIDAFVSQSGQVPYTATYTSDTSDFSAIMDNVAAANVDALFIPCRADTGNGLAAQAANSGVTATLLGTDLWDTTSLDLALLEGAYYSAHYSLADPRSVVQNFDAAYIALDGLSPDLLAALSYDATRIMLQAIARAGVDDPARVRDEMAQIAYEGVSGYLTFDENGEAIKSVAINKIEEGELVFVKHQMP